MNKLVSILLLMVVSNSAMAEWTRVGVFPGGYILVDKATAVTMGNVHKAWFVFNWDTPRKETFMAKPFMSAMNMIYFDCTKRTMQVAGMRAFTLMELKGKEIPAIGIPLATTREDLEHPIYDFQPASAEEAAFNYLCNTHGGEK
jgi:hypothetical protein